MGTNHSRGTLRCFYDAYTPPNVPGILVEHHLECIESQEHHQRHFFCVITSATLGFCVIKSATWIRPALGSLPRPAAAYHRLRDVGLTIMLFETSDIDS